jgi:adenosine deaminase
VLHEIQNTAGERKDLDWLALRTLRPLVQQAREAGLGVTIHVGEEGGAYGIAEIREVVSTLRPDRIGHRILAASDKRLMGQISEAGIVLELCPTSNLLTKALESEEALRDLPRLRRVRGSVHDRDRRPGDDAHAPARRVRAPAAHQRSG